jgi:hypothetical protein
MTRVMRAGAVITCCSNARVDRTVPSNSLRDVVVDASTTATTRATPVAETRVHLSLDSRLG